LVAVNVTVAGKPAANPPVATPTPRSVTEITDGVVHALLFAALRSTALDAVATHTEPIVPVGATATSMVRCAEPSAATEPPSHVTTLLTTEQFGADVTEKPEPRVTVMVVFGAADGPEFATPTVYRAVEPRVTGSEPLTLALRSAAAATVGVMLEVLFATVGSSVVLATTPAIATEPRVPGAIATVMLVVAVVPLASAPDGVHVTVASNAVQAKPALPP